MDQTTTSSTMDNKKPSPRIAQQSSKLHVQDHKDASSKKSTGNRRRQQEWERDGTSGNGGGGRVKASNGGAGALAGKGAWGRSANRAARNREKEGGQIGGHRGEWSPDIVDDFDYFSDNVPLRGGNAKHPCNITQNFLSWWGSSNEGRQRGPNSNSRGAGGRQTASGGGRRKPYHHGGGAGVAKMSNSKARFLQARCQFVMNPCKEAQHVASNSVPVGCSLAAPAVIKTGHVITAPSNLVGVPLLADHQPVAQQQQPVVKSALSDVGNDPDALVPWLAVEEVLVHMTQPTHCPVCLYPPVAPQVTRCGHIYCYPCILHYLALSDKKWRACPICYEMVVRDDLKSAVCIVHPDYSVGSTISMVLMRRQRHSMQPSAVLPPRDYSPHSLARKIPATRAKVMSITDREQSALEVQLAAEGTEPEACFIEQALTLVKERQQVLLEEYSEQDEAAMQEATVLGHCPDGATAEVTDSGTLPGECVTDTDNTEDSVTSDSRERSTRETDETCENVFPHENRSQNSSGNSDSNKSQTTSPPLTIPGMLAGTPIERGAPPSDASVEDNHLFYTLSESSSASSSLSEEVLLVDELLSVGKASPTFLGSMETLQLGEDAREIDVGSQEVDGDGARDSECLNFDFEGEIVNNENETRLSTVFERAVRTSRVVASPNKSHNAPKSTYYFYQASDGSHVYLHSINMAMLRSQYQSEDNCPPTINATIVEKDYFLMDGDLRNRFKALRHLPLCCAFETVELSLQSPLVSPETISIFQKRLSDRQHQRNSRAKEESLIERRNLEQQEKEFSSSLFTRVYSATSSTACNSTVGNRPHSSASGSSDGGSGLMDFPDIAAGDSGRPASSDGFSSPELATSPPARTPQQQQQQRQQQPSFAKMLRVQPTNVKSSEGGGGGGTAGVVWPSLGRNNAPSVGGARSAAATGPGAWGNSSSRRPAVHGNPGRPSSTVGPAVRSDTTDDDELFNVPDYSQTFSQGFDLSLQAAEAAAAARQAGCEGKRGKKGKKKQKQVLLFSSGL